MGEIALAFARADISWVRNTLNTLRDVTLDELKSYTDECVLEEVYSDTSEFIQAVVESKFSNARRNYATRHAVLASRFFKIQHEYLSGKSAICKNCQTPPDKKQGHGAFGKMPGITDGVGREDFYRNPPPEFFGGMYSGVVVVMGRPAKPTPDNPGYWNQDKELWNKSVMKAAEKYCQRPTGDNAKEMNKIFGQFLPRFQIADDGVFAFQKWGIDINTIAFLNLYKCRTHDRYKPHLDSPPSNCLYCANHFFKRQIELLEPRLVIFLSKQIREAASEILHKVGYAGLQCHLLEAEGGKALSDDSHRDVEAEIHKVLHSGPSRRSSASGKLSDYLRKAREGYLNTGNDYAELFEKFKKLRKPAIKKALAEFYADHLIDGIKELVERATVIRPIYSASSLDTGVTAYLQEASIAYIHGLYRSSIFMCRSCMELALKTRFPNFKYIKDELPELINHAASEGAIFKADQDFLQRFRTRANACVHGNEEVNEQDCLEYLNCVRGIVMRLSGRGRENPGQ